MGACEAVSAERSSRLGVFSDFFLIFYFFFVSFSTVLPFFFLLAFLFIFLVFFCCLRFLSFLFFLKKRFFAFGQVKGIARDGRSRHGPTNQSFRVCKVDLATLKVAITWSHVVSQRSAVRISTNVNSCAAIAEGTAAVARRLRRKRCKALSDARPLLRAPSQAGSSGVREKYPPARVSQNL